MFSRMDRVVALAFAMGVNMLLLLLLLRIGVSGSAGTRPEERQHMQIRWVPRSVPVTTVRPSAPSSVERDRGRQVREPKKTDNPVPEKSIVASPPVTVLADDWNKGSASAEGLDLEGATVRRITGAPTPNALGGKRMLPTLEMRDRSFGGAFQRMTQRTDCKELGAALRANPESAQTIAATMRRRGCRT